MSSYAFNPFTSNLDIVGSGASYIDGVVATPASLPVTLNTPALDSVYLAKAGSGVWLISRRPAGLYCRVANNGNANDWVHLGAFPEVNADGNWELYNSADPTKELKFDLSGIATGTTRTITVPNKNVTLDDASDARTPTAHNHAASAITSGVFDNARVNFAAPDAIGSTIANTGAFSTLSASTSLTLGTSGILSGGTNTIEQRNTTSAQTFRLYNTVSGASDANFERGFIGWSSNTLRIGTEAGGTGSNRNVEFVVAGSTRLTLSSTTAAVLATTYRVGNNGDYQFGGPSCRITGTSSGAQNISFQTSSTDRLVLNDTLLGFGGTTSSFPALKRSSTTLQVRLADDSAFAPLEALSFTTANSRIVCDDTNNVIHVGNTPRVSIFGSGTGYLGLGNAHDIRWSNTGRSDQATNFNISLIRDADGILAQRAGTTAQTWRIYNTVSGTNNVNFERTNFRWASNEFIIDAEAGGTGTSLRGIKIGSATSSLLGFYGVTPVDQPATVADPAGGGTVDTEARTAINAIIDRLQELGLIA